MDFCDASSSARRDGQSLPLLGEAVVLLKGLLVDMRIFLKSLVGLVQFLDDGVGVGVLVFREGFIGKNTQVTDVGCTFGACLVSAAFFCILFSMRR